MSTLLEEGDLVSSSIRRVGKAMQEQDVGSIFFSLDVNEAVDCAAGDAPALSKGGESNGCYCRMSALMDR